MKYCKKCGVSQGTLLLRQKDLYCENCFIINVNHKFRACIGKNKVLTHTGNVLICLSGRRGSTALLDLTHNAVSLNNHKKLWITPLYLHVIDVDEDFTDIELIIKQCNKVGYDLHLVHISDYIDKTQRSMTLNTIPQKDKDADQQFRNLINSMSSSQRNDYMSKIKRELFVRCATELQCKTIFTAETASTLAISLLSNLSLGRGSQVQYDVGFCDNRNEVKILRPMKDITHEELEHYVRINQLVSVKSQLVQENSLQSAISSFINDLQENFPSTISTVCKTAEKIGIKDEDSCTNKCFICESGIKEVESKLTALEATNFSRTVSVDNQRNSSMDQVSLSMFPHVNKRLCYACSKNFLEIKTTVPLHLKETLNSG